MSSLLGWLAFVGIFVGVFLLSICAAVNNWFGSSEATIGVGIPSGLALAMSARRAISGEAEQNA